MNLQTSLSAFIHYMADWRRLPFVSHWRSLLPYGASYIEGRFADRMNRHASPRHFRFKLNKPIRLWLSSEHFGMAKGILQDREYSEINLTCEPQYILDLGSNIGLSILALADQFPSAEIAAVEADPRNFPLLLQNLTANHLNVPIIAAAVSGIPGLMSLRIGRNSTCSTLMHAAEIHPELGDRVDVPVLLVDQIMAHLGWSRIDLLKVDIEGSEEGLFVSSPEWLNQVGAIIMEIHPNTSPEAIQGYLQPFGFVLHRHGSGREPVYVAMRGKPSQSLR